ncbi:MAG: DNA repair protein RecO [Kiritimatiellae bacterium]|nr:DNA repair protein RecO [Kiritimatiellia bacterium]
MIVKTEGIVLRVVPLSETSRVVTWLTPDHGKTATLIKGSQRPKSWFLGQYDLFYTCQVLFYARDRAGLTVARECYPLKPRTRLRRDWKAAGAASYLADLAARVCPPDAPHPGLFRLFDEGLDHLAEHGATPAFVLWFELRLLEELGLAPRLHQCLSCRRSLLVHPGSAGSRFLYAHGGILCAACAGRSREKGTRIAPDVLATLNDWQAMRQPLAARRTASSPAQLRAMETLLGQFLVYHLDTPLASRGIAMNLLRSPVAMAAGSA